MSIDEYALKQVPSRKDFSFAEYTTYQLGGKAKIAYFPQNFEQACAVYDAVSKKEERILFLGKGSNLLVSDKGFDGTVICTSKLNDIRKEGSILRCGSGVTVAELLKFCIANCCGGLEYLAGIPASLGGVVCMNGGTNGHYICENVISIKAYDGSLKELGNKECRFGNKHSIMRDINCLVLELNLKTEADSAENIRNKIKKQLEARRHQPKGKSCGCVFKNPAGISAGKLIDQCGLKGYRIGGALVSQEHANFILNDGGTSEDVFSLISRIKKIVFKKTGVSLEEEVIYIGEFHEFNG